MTVSSSSYKNIRAYRKPQGIKLTLPHVAYGLLILYGFTASNYVASGLLLVCCLAFLGIRKGIRTPISSVFLTNLFLAGMFIVLYFPTLQRIIGGVTSIAMPVAWLGMMSTGFFVTQIKPKNDPNHVLVSYLCLGIPAACLLLYSFFLTQQFYGVGDLSGVITTSRRLLVNPFTGYLSAATGISAYASLMISTIGLLFLNANTRYELLLHWLTLVVGVVSVTLCAVVGNRSSIFIAIMVLAIGFTLSINFNQRQGIRAGFIITIIFIIAYIINAFDFRNMIESSFIFSRFFNGNIQEDGRLILLSNAIQNIERYALKGGASFTAHNVFLDILLSGGILPFNFFALLIGVSVINGLRLLIYRQVSPRTRYVIVSVGMTLLFVMMVEPTITGNPFILCSVFFTIGVLSALVESDTPRDRLTSRMYRKN